MKTKNIIYILIVILFIIGLYFWGYSTKGGTAVSTQDTSTTKVSEGSLIATEKFYDFGAISMKDGLVNKVFKISNSSEEDINLMSISTSCMCTVVYITEQNGGKKGPFGMPGHGIVPKANEIIKAGESRDIEVVYDPNAHGPAGVGRINRLVYLEDANGNKLQFEIKANVTP